MALVVDAILTGVAWAIVAWAIVAWAIVAWAIDVIVPGCVAHD